jgi:hypothetical protein
MPGRTLEQILFLSSAGSFLARFREPTRIESERLDRKTNVFLELGIGQTHTSSRNEGHPMMCPDLYWRIAL